MDELRQQLVDATQSPELFERALAEIPDDITALSGQLDQINLYPVKGAKSLTVNGLPLDAARISHSGLTTLDGRIGDRNIVLVVEHAGVSDGKQFTHRALQQILEPKMSLIAADYDGENHLTLSAKGFDSTAQVHLDELRPDSGELIRLGIKDEGAFDGMLLSDDLAIVQWVKAFLGKTKYVPGVIGVAVQRPDYRREVTGDIGGGLGMGTSYSDGAQISLASVQDLDWLNTHNPGRDISMDAFKMNLILSGLPTHALALIGELEVRGRSDVANILVTTLCVRCAATRVVQENGERGDKQHLNWLAEHAPHRPDQWNSPATFGSNAVSKSIGLDVRVGDPFTVKNQKAPYLGTYAFPRTSSR